MSDESRLLELEAQIQEHEKWNQIELYVPYPFQRAFHAAPPGVHISPFQYEGGIAPVRTLLAGNKTGKTYCGAMEVSYHVTGLYPDWWDGEVFSHPIECLVAGVNTDKTRDICQKFLFGEPTDVAQLGTGSVPKTCIGKTTRKAGVQNCYDNVLVRHHTEGRFDGWSKVMFQAYEQKKGAFMGIPVDVGWMDEEPPQDVYNQFVRGVIAKRQYALILTFTAETGGTDLVYKMMNELGPNQALIRAGWRDATHIWDVPGKVAELKSLFPKYEWKMRENGDPVVGTGRVFDVPEDDISIEPLDILPHWNQIIGIDFGLEHPFVAVWLAHDTDRDICYIYDMFVKTGGSIPDLSSALKKHGNIPVAWPHDMAKRAVGVPEEKSGQTIKQLFEGEGVNMLLNHFTNPPKPGEKDGTGGNSVSAGIMAMNDAFKSESFKVFNTLPDWFTEFRNYHTLDGKIVKVHDDRMDASRYGFQSKRFARPISSNNFFRKGALTYDDRAIV